jgi:hypothetical protein
VPDESELATLTYGPGAGAVDETARSLVELRLRFGNGNNDGIDLRPLFDALGCTGAAPRIGSSSRGLTRAWRSIPTALPGQ